MGKRQYFISFGKPHFWIVDTFHFQSTRYKETLKVHGPGVPSGFCYFCGQSELGWVSDPSVKWLTEGYNCRESVFPSPSPSLLGGACLKFLGEGGEDGALAASP